MPKPVSEEIFLTILISTFLVFLFGSLLVVYFFRQQKKRFQHEKEVSELKETFQQIILQSKLEIQELTLDHIAKELHANFSHLVSLININLAAALSGTGDKVTYHVQESKQLAKVLMTEIKTLSVSMNSDHLIRTGFYRALESEVKRLERTGKFEIIFDTIGDIRRFAPGKEIILFRLTQEIFHNIVTHAKATKISVNLKYHDDSMALSIEDNGIGFDLEHVRLHAMEHSSTGLVNMAGRAKLIQAELSVNSQPGKGTLVNVIIPIASEKINL